MLLQNMETISLFLVVLVDRKFQLVVDLKECDNKARIDFVRHKNEFQF